MAKKEIAAKTHKMSKAEKEHIDNMVVLATAIGLIGAIGLLYLYRWLNSSYIMGTRIFIDVLIWICDAGIIAGLVLWFVKKDRKFLMWVPYFASGAFLLAVVRYFDKFKLAMDALYISVLWQKLMDLLHLRPTNQQVAFILVYICIAGYLVATYIYYGLKIKRAK